MSWHQENDHHLKRWNSQGHRKGKISRKICNRKPAPPRPQTPSPQIMSWSFCIHQTSRQAMPNFPDSNQPLGSELTLSVPLHLRSRGMVPISGKRDLCFIFHFGEWSESLCPLWITKETEFSLQDLCSLGLHREGLNWKLFKRASEITR